MNAREVASIAAHLEISVEEFGSRYLRKVGSRYSLIELPNGDCVFYSGGCTVYGARPTQCRTFPFWPENLQSRRAWEEAAAECPGMNRGRLYPLEAIKTLRKGLSDASSAASSSTAASFSSVSRASRASR